MLMRFIEVLNLDQSPDPHQPAHSDLRIILIDLNVLLEQFLNLFSFTDFIPVQGKLMRHHHEGKVVVHSHVIASILNQQLHHVNGVHHWHLLHDQEVLVHLVEDSSLLKSSLPKDLDGVY